MYTRIAIFLLASLTASCPTPAPCGQQAIWSGDLRVRVKVAVTAEGTPVSDLFQLLTGKTDVSLTADGGLGDQKVMIFSPARPLRDVLNDLAEILNCFWERHKGPDGTWRYRLVKGLAARQYDARLARAGSERVLAQLAEQVRALSETPGQLARRPENDPIRRRLQDPNSSARTATLLYSWLSPD